MKVQNQNQTKHRLTNISTNRLNNGLYNRLSKAKQGFGLGLLLLSFLSFSQLGAQVGADGSFSHTIPIKVPAGTGGVAPQLSLYYNSSMPNGMLGVGWQLGGLPIITRMNYGSGINYSTSDTYVGPAGRLVDVSGDASFYRPANEVWAKYVPSGTCAAGPCFWTVYDNDGNILKFGSTADSRIEAVGKSGAVRVWALTELKDSHGNYYEVEYDEDTINGDYYPKKITYTKGNALTVQRTIEFIYEERTDHRPEYSQGALVDSDQRLKEIHIYSGYQGGCVFDFLCDLISGDLVAKYILSYESSALTGKSLLHSVTLHGSDGTSTRLLGDFEYGGAWGKLSVGSIGSDSPTPSSSFRSNNYTQRFSDINGDGFPDMLVYRTDIQFPLYAYFNDGSGRMRPGDTAIHPSHQYNWETHFIDMNADGFPDYLRSDTHGSPSIGARMYVYFNDGNGNMTAGSVGSDSPTPSSSFRSNNYTQRFSDINGDGFPDMLVYRTDTHSPIYAYLNDGSGKMQPNYTVIHPSHEYRWETHIIDMNADGFPDYLRSDAHGSPSIGARMYVYFNDGNGNMTAGSVGSDSPTPSSSFHSNNYTQRFSDINGDGFPDMLVYRTDTHSPIYAYLNDGNGKMQPNYTVIHPSHEYRWETHIIDMNADGFPDYLRSDAHGSPSIGARMHVYFNDGTTLDLLNTITNQNGSTTSVEYELSTQHNSTDNSGATWKAVYAQSTSTNGIANTLVRPLVTKVTTTDGRGASYSSRYLYHDGRRVAGAIPDRADLGFARVREINEQTNIEVTTNYRQDKPYQQQVDRVLTEVIVAGVRNTISDNSNYSYALLGNCTTNSGCQYNTANAENYPRIVVQTGMRTQKYKGTAANSILQTLTMSKQYDVYGNLKVSGITNQVGASGSSYSTYTAQNLINDHAQYAIGLVYESKSCKGTMPTPVAPSSPIATTNPAQNCTSSQTISHQRSYYHHPNQGVLGNRRLISKREKLTGSSLSPVWATSLYSYDSYGNLVQTTLANGTITKKEYDNVIHAYLVKKTDAEGLVSRFSYDYGHDLSIEKIDPNGIRSVLTVDAFGRVTQKKLSDSSGTLLKRQTIQFADGDASRNLFFVNTCDWLNNQIKYCQKEFRDGLGRVYRTMSPGEDGIITVDSQFDNAGRVVRVSTPYYYGGSYEWTNYSYDSIGRRTSINHPNGTFTRFNYNIETLISGAVSSKTTIDANNQTTKTWYDHNGKAIKVQEAVGTSEETNVNLSYDHYTGRLVSVQAPPRSGGTGELSQITYDEFSGRVTQRVIPGMGTATYTYGSTAGQKDFGRLIQESYAHPNAASGTVNRTYTYDDLGRRTGYTSSNGDSLSMSYSEAKYAYSKGRLTTEEYTSNGYTVTKNYSYATGGEVATVHQSLKQGATVLMQYQESKTWDALGRLQETIYPDGSEIHYCYLISSGLLSKVNLDGDRNCEGGVNYAQYSGYNTRGQIGSVQFSNGMKTTYTYDVQTGLLTNTRSFSRGNESSPLLDYSYTHNNIGKVTNISSGIDSQRDYNTIYTYDGLGRIKRADASGVSIPDYNYGFDKAGNLTNNNGKAQVFGNGNRMTNSGTETLNWSARGSLLSRRGGTASVDYVYNDDSFLTQVQVNGSGRVRYVYDANGKRVLKLYTDPADSNIVYRTYYLGENYEIREKIVSGTVSEAQASRYVFTPSGEKIAVVTLPGTTGSSFLAHTRADQYNQHFPFTEMIASSNLAAFLNKGFHVLSAYTLHQHTPHRLQLAFLLTLVMLLGLVYLRYVLGMRVIREGWLCTITFDRDVLTPFVRLRPYMAHASIALVLVFGLSCLENSQSVFHASSENSSDDNRNWENINGMPWISSQAMISSDTSMGLPVGTYFYHSDYLGSTTLLTDATAAEVSRIRYTPYGSVDSAQSSGTGGTAYKFTGQEYDPEAGPDLSHGLYYYHSRYYDPNLGVFTQADSIAPGDGLYSQGLNRFMYVAGDPVNYIDPSGYGWFSKARDWVDEKVVRPTKKAPIYRKVVVPVAMTTAAVSLNVTIGNNPIATGLLYSHYEKGNFFKSFGQGFVIGSGNALIGLGGGLALNGVNAFAAGYNDVYSHDDLGRQAFFLDHTIGSGTTAIGTGQGLYHLSSGAHFEKDLSIQSNAFIFSDVQFDRSNSVGNVVGLDTKTTENLRSDDPDLMAEAKRVVREELLHNWQYRRKGFPALYGLAQEQKNMEEGGYPYFTPGTLEYDASTRSTHGGSGEGGYIRRRNGSIFYDGTGYDRPHVLKCSGCDKFF